MKKEIKKEEKFKPSVSEKTTASTMSVGHTPTTQGGAVRRPPPPPGGSGRGSPLPPQDGATGGNPPPPETNPQGTLGNNQPKSTEFGMPTTLQSCKIAFNNSVDQFNQLQEKIVLFSHHLKHPYNQAKGNKIDQYFNQLIIITAKLEKYLHQAEKYFKYSAMREEFEVKSSSIGNLMVAYQTYLQSAKSIPTPFTPIFSQSQKINPNLTPISLSTTQQNNQFIPNPGLNPNVHLNPNFTQVFQNPQQHQQNIPPAPQFQQRNNVPNFQKQFKTDKLLHSFNITEF